MIWYKKDLFPKSVNAVQRIFSGWKNKFNGSIFTEASDGIAFTTTGNEAKNNNEKEEITFYKCGKTGKYSNECDEDQTVKITNKNVSSFLLLNDDKINSSSDEDYDNNTIMGSSYRDEMQKERKKQTRNPEDTEEN